jgi:hypothetical protein
MKVSLLLPLAGACLLAAGCGGKSGPRSASAGPAKTGARAATSGFATARARLGGMRCATIGLRGGAAIGRYHLYVCAGPDDAGLGVPPGAYVCWGFHDFGLGREQPAVKLNLMDRGGRTIGGHVYPDTTLNCQRTLKAVASVI